MFEKCTHFIILLVLIMLSNQQVMADETTTDGSVTDVDQGNMDKELMMDYGQYTTTNFHYAVHQWINHWSSYPWIGKHTDQRLEMCYHQYLKCLTSQESPSPVCLFYTQVYETGYKTAETYCDGYLENCRIGYQYWRTISYGKCVLGRYIWGKDEIVEY